MSQTPRKPREFWIDPETGRSYTNKTIKGLHPKYGPKCIHVREVLSASANRERGRMMSTRIQELEKEREEWEACSSRLFSRCNQAELKAEELTKENAELKRMFIEMDFSQQVIDGLKKADGSLLKKILEGK